jgi:hypothetical protein
MRDASQFAARAVREFRGALSELRGIRRDRDRSAALAAKRMYAGQEGVVDSWARPVPITPEQQMSAYVFLDPDAYRDPSEGTRDWIAGSSPAPESTDSDGDEAMHDWIAGGSPAPVHSEEPREHAFTEGGAILAASDADADSLLDREWAGAGEPPAIRASRESIDEPTRTTTNPAEPATMRVEPGVERDGGRLAS